MLQKNRKFGYQGNELVKSKPMNQPTVNQQPTIRNHDNITPKNAH